MRTRSRGYPLVATAVALAFVVGLGGCGSCADKKRGDDESAASEATSARPNVQWEGGRGRLRRIRRTLTADAGAPADGDGGS